MKLDNPDIKQFDLYAAAILGELYHSFPEPCELDPAWSYVITPLFIEEGLIEGELYKEVGSLDTCIYTMSWLFESGMFKADYDKNSECYDNARLTEKGFEILNRKINSSDKTVGQKFSEFSADIGKGISSDYIKELVKWLISLLV